MKYISIRIFASLFMLNIAIFSCFSVQNEESNDYLEIALELNAWGEEVFMDKIEGFEPDCGGF